MPETPRVPVEDLVYLLRCAVCGEKPDLPRVAAMDAKAVLALAARHRLSAAAAFALSSAGSREESVPIFASAVREDALFARAMDEVSGKLIAAGITFMPLKGAVLKSYYPHSYFREMHDLDFLVDPERMEDVRAIMESLGYKTISFGRSSHDKYLREPVVVFEMHRCLFGPEHQEKLASYYSGISGRLLGDGCEKHLSPEDFYLYVLAHEYKHYSEGGTGLRSLLDTYLILRHDGLDESYVEAEAEKIGIAEFEKANRSLALHLFGGEPLTDEDG